MQSGTSPVLLILLAGLFVLAVAFILLYTRYSRLRWTADREKAIREDAVLKSQATTLGKVVEHFIPYLPGFRYNPRDARFLGSPIDLIVFDGLSDGEVKEVVFLEVKTGSSGLTTRERRVRDAIDAGRVRWEELREPTEVPQPDVPSTPLFPAA